MMKILLKQNNKVLNLSNILSTEICDTAHNLRYKQVLNQMIMGTKTMIYIEIYTQNVCHTAHAKHKFNL